MIFVYHLAQSTIFFSITPKVIILKLLLNFTYNFTIQSSFVTIPATFSVPSVGSTQIARVIFAISNPFDGIEKYRIKSSKKAKSIPVA